MPDGFSDGIGGERLSRPEGLGLALGRVTRRLPLHLGIELRADEAF